MKTNFINLNEYDISDRIGEGPMSEVFQLKSKQTDSTYTIKILRDSIQKEDNKKENKKFSRAIESASKLNFPSIAKFIGFSPIEFYSGKQTLAMISEYITNKNLSQMIELSKKESSDTKLNETEKLIIIYGIAKSMEYLHSNKIIHCDLKTENIILDNNNYPMITDFALSKITHQMLNGKSIESTSKVHGNICYLPPEYFTNYKYTKKGDVYAFSMILYEILTGEKPFNNYDSAKIVQEINKSVRPNFNSIISKAYQTLIEKCWDQNPNNRPTFKQIAEQLKTDEDFLTESIDKEKFNNFVSKFPEIEETETKSATPDKDDKGKEKKPKAKKTKSEPKLNKEADKKKSKPKMKKSRSVNFDESNLLNENDSMSKSSPKSDKANVEEADYEVKKSRSVNFDEETLVKAEKLKQTKSKIKRARSMTEISKKDRKQESPIASSKETKPKSESPKPISPRFLYRTRTLPMKNSDQSLKFGKAAALEEKENKKILQLKKEAEDALNSKIDEFKNLMTKDNEEIKLPIDDKIVDNAKTEATTMTNENSEQAKDDIQKWEEKIADVEIEKYSTTIERKKKIDDYDEMYQAAQNMYIVSLCAHRLIGNDKYLNTKRDSLEKMDLAAQNASFSTIAEHGIFLYRLRSIETPDYDKIGQFLKIAGLNGEKFCLTLYLSLVDQEIIYNKDVSDLGNLYEKLSHYEHRERHKKKSDKYFKIAVNYYQKGAYSNKPESMVRYGILIEEGRIKDKNVKPMLLYKKGTEMGHPSSMYKYADSIEKSGTLYRSELNKAVELYIKASTLNDPNAMFRYAQIIEETCMIKSERLKAIDLYRKAAELNQADAMFRYAQILEKGIVVMSDLNKALQYYKRAADSEELKYVIYYAILIKTGRLGHVDFKEAAKYFKMAYELEDNESFLYYSYALMHDHGIGVPVNIPLAIEYYKMAADKGNVEAMFDYAMIFHNGQGVRPNKMEAAKYYKMAADQGHSEARFNYCMIMNIGDEIPISQEQSDHYLLMTGNKK